MPWTSTFLAALASPAARVRLSLAKIPDSWGPGTATGTATSVADTGVHGISMGAPLAMSSQSVTVPNWSGSRGTARVALGSVAAGQWAAANLPRGALVTIGARVPGMATADAVFRGQLRDIDGVGPQSVASAWDILASLASKSEWFSGLDSGALFYHCDPDSIRTRTLTASYDYATDTTLQVNTTADFGRQTSSTGAVLITPISGGTPFIATFTSQAGTTVSGVSTTHGYGPLPVIAGIGSTVQEVAWMVGHPLEVAARILASTGTGTNGAYDVYPAAWGFGLPATYIDGAGIAQWVSVTNPSSGTHSVRIVSDTPQAPALDWLQSQLALYAMWLTMRQGDVTGRGAVDYGASLPPLVMTLDRTNILRGNPQRSIYDTSSPVEYARTATRFNTLLPQTVESTLTTPETRPALLRYLTDYGDAIYQNHANIAARLNGRIGAWREAVPHSVDIVCRLDAAQLCPGDWVTLDHPGLWMPTNTGADARRAMVSDMSVDWSVGEVTLRLYLLPVDALV